MTRKSLRLGAVRVTLFASIAVALPLTLYASGFPTVGGALLLSGVLVFAVAVMRSGALSTGWLAGRTRRTIENAARLELSKAWICAGLAIDVLFNGAHLLDRYRVWNYDISLVVILTVVGLLAVAGGLFLTRWFAGYLFTRR